jgi:hypothetical protein
VLDRVGGVKARIDGALESALWGAIAAAAAGAGISFLLIALFLWLAARYGPLTACMALGTIFAAAAAVSAIAFALTGRSPARPLRGAMQPDHGAINDLLAAADDRRQAAAKALRDVAETLSADITATIHRRPLTTLGLALCAGFVFGARRRR